MMKLKSFYTVHVLLLLCWDCIALQKFESSLRKYVDMTGVYTPYAHSKWHKTSTVYKEPITSKHVASHPDVCLKYVIFYKDS